MRLRSGNTYEIPEREELTTTTALYQVDIDFDEASREWRRNKKKYGQGCFQYLRRSSRN